RQVDIGHAAAAQLTQDFVFAQLAAGAENHCPLPFRPGAGGRLRMGPVGLAGCRKSREKWCSRTGASGTPAGSVRGALSKTLPVRTGLASPWIAMAALSR